MRFLDRFRKPTNLRKVGDSHYVVNRGMFATFKRRLLRLFFKQKQGGFGVPGSKTVPLNEVSAELEEMEEARQKARLKSRPASPKRQLNISMDGMREALRSLFVRGLVFGVVGVGAWISWTAYKQGDTVFATAASLMTVGALYGFWRGIIASIVSLIGFIAAYLTAPKLGAAYEHLAAEQFGTSGLLNRAIAIGLAGLIVFAVFSLVSSLVWRLIAGPSNERATIDRLLGLVGGGAHMAFSVLLFLSGLSVIEPMLPAAADVPEGAVGAQRVVALNEMLQVSRLKPWVDEYNVFENVPDIEESVSNIHETLVSLDGPDRVRYLMKHPAVMKMREDPEMQKAVQGLAGEPEIVALMTGKRPFDKQAVSTLLKSDAVLHLLQQPGFLETANGILVGDKKKDGDEETASTTPEPESPSTRTKYTSQESDD